jgi:hypothetical protein
MSRGCGGCNTYALLLNGCRFSWYARALYNGGASPGFIGRGDGMLIGGDGMLIGGDGMLIGGDVIFRDAIGSIGVIFAAHCGGLIRDELVLQKLLVSSLISMSLVWAFEMWLARKSKASAFATPVIDNRVHIVVLLTFTVGLGMALCLSG